MKNSANKISAEQAKNALLRSGYLLESRLDTVLRKKGYYVEANTAYPDPATGKSRELDFQCAKTFDAGPKKFDRIYAVLLIECVNNLHPITFITKNPQDAPLDRYEIKFAGLPVKIRSEKEPDYLHYLTDYLGMDRYHHYCKGRQATQFCSFIKKKGTQEWMATHIEEHFDSFRKLSDAVEYFIDEQFKNLILVRSKNVDIEFFYPVVVLGGDLLDARPGKESVTLIKTNQIKYRRSGLVGTISSDYLIDVVTERFFPKYLMIIEQEISKTARLLRSRHITVRKTIEEIVQSARGIRSPEKIREVLEF